MTFCFNRDQLMVSVVQSILQVVTIRFQLELFVRKA